MDGRGLLRAAAIAVLGSGLSMLGATSTSAKEVSFPKTDPHMSMTIPDGWSVAYTDAGVEMRSPEKDSVIFASILKRDRARVNAWTQLVLSRLLTVGVTLDRDIKVPSPPTPRADAPQAIAPADLAKVPPEPDMPGTPAIPSFATTGAPSLDTPNLAMASRSPVASAAATPKMAQPDVLPVGAQKAPPTINGLKFQVIQYFGGRFKDRPTDIQLALFTLPHDEVFAVEQQSLPEDDRAVAVVSSVKAIKN